jgi:hypothetical protein
MNTKHPVTFSLVAIVALLSGCASSPVGQPTAYPTPAQAVVLAAGTGGGALLGNSINHKYGAPVGAVVGLGAGLLTDMYFTDKEKSAYAEGYAQGARETRAAMLKQYWEEQTTKARSNNSGSSTSEAPETSYNGGVVAGVRFGPRSADDPNLTEPTR